MVILGNTVVDSDNHVNLHVSGHDANNECTEEESDNEIVLFDTQEAIETGIDADDREQTCENPSSFSNNRHRQRKCTTSCEKESSEILANRKCMRYCSEKKNDIE